MLLDTVTSLLMKPGESQYLCRLLLELESKP